MNELRNLVLTTKVGETLEFTDSAGVTFKVSVDRVGLNRRTVRQVIQAPLSIRVVRGSAVVRDAAGAVGQRSET